MPLSVRRFLHDPQTVKLLGSMFSLHDVRDVEGLCRTTIDRRLRGWNATLAVDEYESLLTAIITICWQLSLKYDQAHGLKFSTYASKILERRVVDWYRSRFGDSRYGPPPELTSIAAYSDDLEEVTSGRREALGEDAQSYEEVEFRVAIGR